jgi:primosomal protein N' (replication factor Y)
MIRAVNAAAFEAILLDGVTGSGKTETYFEAIAAALMQGRQALILLPEIALTVQFLDRFARRFGQAGRMAFRPDTGPAPPGLARRGRW